MRNDSRKGRWVRVCSVLMLGVLGACASNDHPPPRTSLFDAGNADVRAEQGRKPKVGLALSGGGSKAAVFAHGVLHGLHDAEVLPHVDVISTTSGGGYAAYWYFSRRLALGDDYGKAFADCFPAWMFDGGGNSQQRLLAVARTAAQGKGMAVCEDVTHFAPGDPYRWQAHLLRWPDVFKVGRSSPLDSQQVFPTVNLTTGLLTAFLEAPFNALQGIDDSYVGLSYQYGIERAWGLEPLPREPARKLPSGHVFEQWDYANGVEGHPRFLRSDLLRVDPDRMQWSQLREQYGRQKNLPLWILNTTEGQKESRRPNPNDLFEITPFSYGSPRWGYRYEPEAPRMASISSSVRASAAFADSQGLGSEKWLPWLEGAAQVLPSLTWGVDFKYPGHAEPLRLSDGGGADNLALVSAVRRELDDIIVVDTAEDAKGTMDDLCWSRALLMDAGFAVEFEALERLDDVCAAQIDSVEDRPVPRQSTGPWPARGYNVSAWVNPVIKGSVRNQKTGKVTRLWLIKAAWNEQAVWRAGVDEPPRCGFGADDVNCFLALFYWDEFGLRQKDYMSFPQHGTVGLTLSGRSAVTLAYRELGRMLASQLKMEGGRIALPRENCKQPVFLLGEHKGARPEPWYELSSDRKVPGCPAATR